MTEPRTDRLVDIIEQAIFQTDTGLEAALLAAELIRSEVGDPHPCEQCDQTIEYWMRRAIEAEAAAGPRAVSRVMDTSPDLFMVTTAEHPDRAFIAGARGQHEAEAAAGPRAVAIVQAGYEAAAGPREGHRPEWSFDVPTGFCECGKPYPHEAAAGPRENRADTIDSVGDAVNALRYIAQELDRLF